MSPLTLTAENTMAYRGIGMVNPRERGLGWYRDGEKIHSSWLRSY